MEQLQTELAKYQRREKKKEAEWIPVDERLPELNKMVLLYLEYGTGDAHQIVGSLCDSKDGFKSNMYGYFKAFYGGRRMRPAIFSKEQVIAWRPLPEPPVKKEKMKNEEA